MGGIDDRTVPAKPTWLDGSVSILNAIVGDYLEQTDNGLAIEMAYYARGKALELTKDALRDALLASATDKVCVLVHGMACNESCWFFPGQPETSYGTLLQQDFGYTPLSLRYNSGRHISDNGKAFAGLLEKLSQAYPMPIKELVLIGHSMGGLLIRSACHYGEAQKHQWPRLLRAAFYLGSPHLGAPLEKLGGALSIAMHVVNEPVTRLVRKVVNLRSRGIKDLRHANLVDEDWLGGDPDTSLGNRRVYVPLQRNVQHYVVAGTLAKDERHLISQLFGDAVVRVASATGQPADETHAPRFPTANLRIVPGLGHMNLTHDADVYRIVREGCAATATETEATGGR
ncbi:MAG: alpha/beta hydrolase [Deltaproteobacteria bacterium]|nr:alpha/beta hydrolase [Deltaproteobacteria bacterium]